MLVQTVLFYGRCESIHLTQGEPGIKYLLQEGMPRKGSSLAKSLEPHQLHDQLLWSSQWDVVVMWLYGLGQVDPGQVLGLMSVVLNYENCRDFLICLTLPVFLSSYTVPLAP